MAITYPLAVADFWERLRFADRPTFVQQHNKSQSVSGGGDILSSFRGQPKWVINVTLAGGWHDRNLITEADIMHLNSRDGTVLAYDIRHPFPDADPDGWKLDGMTVTIASKGSDNRSLSLEGLRPQFVVTKGDKISVLYDTDKRFLFEVMETVQADDTGETPEFEIWPYMPPTLAVADVVTMRKACGKFKLQAGSYRPSGGSGNMAAGFSFSLISVP
jgi:hypothetical protein